MCLMQDWNSIVFTQRSSVLRDAITAVFEAVGIGESNTEVGIVSIILPSIVQQSILSVSFSGLTVSQFHTVV